MKIVITESPTKATTISQFLEDEFEVVSCQGHIRDLPKGKLGLDIEDNFKPQYVIPTKKRKLVNQLKKKCEKVGRDYAKIEKSCWPAGQLLLAQNQIELNKKISIFKPEGVTIEDFKKYTLTATPETCMEELQVYLNLGVSYFMLFFADLPSMDSLRQFSRVMIN